MAAAISAKREGIKDVLVIERYAYLGGILNQCIHNGFGLKKFALDLTGPEYAQRYIHSFLALGIDCLLDTCVLHMTPSKKMLVTSSAAGLQWLSARSVVFAMGCRERTRGNLNIPGDRPAGVLTAGTAQRLMNIEGLMVGKKIVILGSGDIGLIMARRCTLEGADVQAVVEILPHPSGLNRNVQQCLADYRIPLYLSHTVICIKGRRRVEKVITARVDKKLQKVKGTEKEMACDTLLLSVGLIPECELVLEAGVKICPQTGGPFVDEMFQTSRNGFFACGNVVQVYDLVDSVSESGHLAGKAAARYVRGLVPAAAGKVPLKTSPPINSVVPQFFGGRSIDEGANTWCLRVQKPLKEPVFWLKNQKGVLGRIPKPYAVPSEMVFINVSKYKQQILESDTVTIQAGERT